MEGFIFGSLRYIIIKDAKNSCPTINELLLSRACHEVRGCSRSSF